MDGITQVSDILSGYGQINAVHFFTHGTEGNIKIGSDWLNEESVAAYSSQISSWSASLSENGDLMFYGCDVAATPESQEFLADIAELTSADIAASTDTTGHWTQGGDWILEYHLGEIETSVPLPYHLQDSWQHIMAAESVGDDFDTIAYNNNNGTVNWLMDWTEVGDDGLPSTGVITIATNPTSPTIPANLTNQLHLTTADKTDTQRAIYREADLSGASSASISFDYETDSAGGQKGYVKLQARAAATDLWVTIGEYEIKADEALTQSPINLTPYISSTTQIQFTSTGTDHVDGDAVQGVSKGVDNFFIDNLIVNYNTSANTAPVLTPAAPSLPGITEDDLGNAGQAVSSFLSSTDVDPVPLAGIAVTGSSVTGGGGWQYSTDGGTTWTAVGVVSDGSALLLRDTDLVRFEPDGVQSASASFDFRAWDQTSGSVGSKVDATANGGTTAFSSASDTASISVSDVNDAPVLTPAAPSLPGITEDDLGNAGQAVSSFLSSTDVDPVPLAGIAVTGSSVTGGGGWQYSTDGGTTWTAVGVVSDGSALLLRDTDLVRFEPDGVQSASASFDFRAWDQTSGSVGSKVDATANGGTTAFSSASDTASISVSDVNDAPVLTPAAPSLPGITEDDIGNAGQAVSSFLSSTDVDAAPLAGIAVTGSSVTATAPGSTPPTVVRPGRPSAICLRQFGPAAA